MSSSSDETLYEVLPAKDIALLSPRFSLVYHIHYILYVNNISWQKTAFSSAFLFLFFFTIVLILFVAGGVSSFTLVDTLRCVSTFSTAGRSAAIHMVLTGGDGVGAATWRESGLGTRNNTHKTICITQRTDQCGSHKGLRRRVRPWSRSPRQRKGSHHCIYYLIKQNKALTSQISRYSHLFGYIIACCQH